MNAEKEVYTLETLLPTRLANNQVTCQDLLAYLLTLASKSASHEASFFPSKQVVEALLACLLVGLVGWRFRRRIAGSMVIIKYIGM